jgi:hypothetical protein
MTDNAKKTWLGRMAAWFASRRAKRGAKLKKREDDRIRRVVAKETAVIKRTTERAKRRARK